MFSKELACYMVVIEGDKNSRCFLNCFQMRRINAAGV